MRDDSSTPSRGHVRTPSDTFAGLSEHLQEFDSFSLPPGLYAPEVPNTLSAQATSLAQPASVDQMQTQVGPVRLPVSDRLSSVQRTAHVVHIICPLHKQSLQAYAVASAARSCVPLLSFLLIRTLCRILPFLWPMSCPSLPSASHLQCRLPRSTRARTRSTSRLLR